VREMKTKRVAGYRSNTGAMFQILTKHPPPVAKRVPSGWMSTEYTFGGVEGEGGCIAVLRSVCRTAVKTSSMALVDLPPFFVDAAREVSHTLAKNESSTVRYPWWGGQEGLARQVWHVWPDPRGCPWHFH
jgi:hypothetical protein